MPARLAQYSSVTLDSTSLFCHNRIATRSRPNRIWVLSPRHGRDLVAEKRNRLGLYRISERQMKEIPLSKGHVAIVDDDDYEKICSHRWYALERRGGTVAMRTQHAPRKTIYMARQIVNAPAGMYVDHANHDTLDNRRANLRICTNAQNISNGTPQRGRSSRYKGVSFSKSAHKWHAYIRCSPASREHLGYFENEDNAARAYNIAATRLFGEFAWLNTIEEEGGDD